MTTTYTHQLERGLVITGPQGSKKTRLALKIALGRGVFKEIEFGPNFRAQLSDALRHKPRTLIINGDPSKTELADIKIIVTSQNLQLRPPFSKEKMSVPSPLIIICTQDHTRWLFPENRRFDLINLDQKAAA